MADYNDISVGPSFTELAADEQDTIIYCEEGEIRFTAHSNPTGNTTGVRLAKGVAHLVKANTVIRVRSNGPLPARLVRTVA